MIKSLIELVVYLCAIGQLLVMATVFISWFNLPRSHPAVRKILQVGEMMYSPLRRVIPEIPGPFDWTPMICMVILTIIQGYFQSLAPSF
ncbi:MAG: YggT family protein [Proteobacteria bacterium]|nr:YggT family protein [Pseudomonadota bacterium]